MYTYAIIAQNYALVKGFSRQKPKLMKPMWQRMVVTIAVDNAAVHLPGARASGFCMVARRAGTWSKAALAAIIVTVSTASGMTFLSSRWAIRNKPSSDNSFSEPQLSL